MQKNIYIHVTYTLSKYISEQKENEIKRASLAGMHLQFIIPEIAHQR